MPSIDTLISDIHKVLDKGAVVDGEVAKAFGERIAALVTKRLSRYGTPRRKPRLSMSMLGKNPKQLWYELNGAQGEELDVDTKMKFLYGDLIEELVLFLAEVAGHSVTDRQSFVSVEGVVGAMDAKIDGEVVDVKSSSDFSYSKFEDGTLFDKDSLGYVAQLSGYAYAEGKDVASFVALNKETGQLCRLVLPKEKMIDVPKRIAEIRTILAKENPPEGTCSIKVEDNGNEFLAAPCSYCSQKWNCHPGLRAFMYSTGLKYFTKVCKEPRVPEST